ncbi:dephospho-CoA kinase [Arboricoccus pini]|uniref:Dephospho-CoA kinase n=1 Tax=Arboricoccus pini TaxID=1963835 RepID=A0A212QSW5_9PROT|nr:dephospho-CoA kinase [Arboricoccus pini]SNB62690.1 dephospho-CoA kinase [Arboricoccus pini]
MLVLGLTGSLAMGKSRTAAMFMAHGIPVFDSDATVHGLYAPGGAAVLPILRLFEDCGSVSDGIDRAALGRRILSDDTAMRALERVVHALVRSSQRAFLETQARLGHWLTVLDIPLLYESGGDRRCDRIVVVSASPFIQSQRALARTGMTALRLKSLLERQTPDLRKQCLADFVIHTGGDRGRLSRNVAEILRKMRQVQPHAWPKRW